MFYFTWMQFWDEKACFGFLCAHLKKKGAVCSSIIQNTVCQIQRISPRSPLAVRSVCALKKQSGVHTQPWFCKWETNRDSDRATTPFYSQVFKYQQQLVLVHRTTLMLCVTRASLTAGSFVYCEYLPLHLSPVSGSFIIGVSKSINIHCI